MSAYLTVTFEYENAADASADFPGDGASSYECEPVSDTPPVVLRGLVKGGEYASPEDWSANVGPVDALCLAADGRIVIDYNQACEAEDRGALPITWYRYEEP